MKGLRLFFLIAVLFGLFPSAAQDNADSIDASMMREAQQYLALRGYEVGKVDGIYGPQTSQAIKEFQLIQRLEPTGHLNAETMSALRNGPYLKTGRSTSTQSSEEGGSLWPWVLGAGFLWWLWKKGKEPTKQRPRQRQATKRHRTSTMSTDDELFEVTIDVSTNDYRHTSSYGSSYGTYPTRGNGRASYNKKESEKCWVPKGRSISVNGVTIDRGMLYVGSKLAPQKGYGGHDNCLINPKLKVARNSSNVSNEYMPYWPSYEDISPKHRRAYLEWLSTGACDPDVYIGYVFLYFYGLERRLFLDQATDDFDDIIEEMQRLLTVYGHNRSIVRYLGEALSYSSILMQKNVPAPKVAIPDATSWELSQDIKLFIGQKLKQEPVLQVEDLLVWFLYHPECHLRTPASRLENEFIELLQKKLAAKYPSGLKIRMPKRKLAPKYNASSNTFIADLSSLVSDIPDISSLKSPIDKVQAVADEAMDDLDKLSRYLGRNPNQAGTFRAAMLLPKELIRQHGGAEVQALVEWLKEETSNSQGMVPVSELAAKILGGGCDKITKSVHKEIHGALAALGWSMYPSPYETIGLIGFDAQVKLVDENPVVDASGPAYLLAILELTLGAYIAHADDTFTDLELQQLMERVEDYNHLGEGERNRLRNVLGWLAVEKPDLGALKRKIKSVDDATQKALAQIALSVAASDGYIAPQEVRVLETMYQTLGMDKRELFSNLHSLSVVDGSDQAAAHSSDTADIKIEAAPISLDMNKVSATLQDTAKASTLLANIFSDDEEPPANSIEDELPESGDGGFDGLDKAHAQLLAELLARPEWPRNEYEQLASSLKLMPDGAMETINEWAFNHFDDAIMEDDDPITIYTDIVQGGPVR